MRRKATGKNAVQLYNEEPVCSNSHEIIAIDDILSRICKKHRVSRHVSRHISRHARAARESPGESKNRRRVKNILSSFRARMSRMICARCAPASLLLLFRRNSICRSRDGRAKSRTWFRAIKRKATALPASRR